MPPSPAPARARSHPPAPARALHFGSSQERQLMPANIPPDRLGNTLRRDTAPHRGPGCYDNHQYGTMVYNLEKTPMSRKGYGLSARTAERFPPARTAERFPPARTAERFPPTPGEASPSLPQDQSDPTSFKKVSPGKAPFGSNSQRFRSEVQDCPGPWSYSPGDPDPHRKLTWPMCFGRPDWSRLPELKKRSHRVMLPSERELLKQRSRLAYLSLYY